MSSVPVVKNQQGQIIVPAKMMDETTLSVEPNTGYTTNVQQRVQKNYQVFDDLLFIVEGNTEYGKFIPLVYIDREGAFT